MVQYRLGRPPLAKGCGLALEPCQVAQRGRVELAGLHESLPGERADRLQEAVAGRHADVLDVDQALVDEAG